MAVYRAVWPGCALSFPAEATLIRPWIAECPGPRLVPYVYSSTADTNRKVLLDRSVFDLVDAHRFLSLTDPQLLGWYLRLSPEDRKLIQDEGGFHQFLQRHPGLELSRYHVYVKYLFGSPEILPTFATENHALRTAGAKQSRSGATHSHLELEMFPGNVKETLTLCSLDGSQKRPQERIGHTERLSPLSDGFQTGLSPPVRQEPDHHAARLLPLDEERPPWQMDDALTDVSVELDRRRQRGESGLGTTNYSVQNEGQMVYGNDRTSEDQSKKFCSVMDDTGILAYLADEDVKASVDPFSTDSERPEKDTAEKHTSTELPPSPSAFTQTEAPGTSDKHVITEVHMADLDYLAEEFIKLKMAKEEQREQKQTVKSSGCKSRKKCDCVQRAQQAELSLLLLHFSLCRQHCWRLYYTSAQGAPPPPQLTDTPANIKVVLQKLESDYSQMREKILAGVPLRQLQPLSVDSERITTGASYTPAQIVGDVLGNVPSGSSQELQDVDALSEENGRQSKNDPERCTKKEKQTSKVRRAVTVAPKDKDAAYKKQEKKQTEAACRELNSGEAWYDAEEDLQPVKEKSDESASEEAKRSALLVSNLPGDATEGDVMRWFEKYQVCEVSVSDLHKDFRVAMVTTSGPERAEAAATELNGCCVRGRALRVQHVGRAAGGGRPQETQSSDSTERKPPRGRKLVCISPTAKGTCVPEHYGTMGSFDSLTEELTRLHPHAGRQKIADALIELRAEHRGGLGGLPLAAIREMASERLRGQT